MRNDDKEKKKEKGLISFERKKCPLFCDDFEHTIVDMKIKPRQNNYEIIKV